MTFEEFLDNILVIVVLYRTTIQDCQSITSITDSLKYRKLNIFVYDNSPEYNINNVENIDKFQIFYFQDFTNSGVSLAYNEGAIVAQKMNKRWLLLCDQDTAFTFEYFNEIYNCPKLLETNLFAPKLISNKTQLSPCSFIFNYGSKLKSDLPSGITLLKGISLLNSGLLIQITSFNKCGGYNPKVFLDFSDFEFLKRFKKCYSNFYLLDINLEHHLESIFLKTFNENRFIQYCKSYRGAIHNFVDFVLIGFIVLSRSFKQSLVFRTFLPIYIFINFFIIENNAPQNK